MFITNWLLWIRMLHWLLYKFWNGGNAFSTLNSIVLNERRKNAEMDHLSSRKHRQIPLNFCPITTEHFVSHQFQPHSLCRFHLLHNPYVLNIPKQSHRTWPHFACTQNRHPYPEKHNRNRIGMCKWSVRARWTHHFVVRRMCECL